MDQEPKARTDGRRWLRRTRVSAEQAPDTAAVECPRCGTSQVSRHGRCRKCDARLSTRPMPIPAGEADEPAAPVGSYLVLSALSDLHVRILTGAAACGDLHKAVRVLPDDPAILVGDEPVVGVEAVRAVQSLRNDGHLVPTFQPGCFALTRQGRALAELAQRFLAD